MGATGISAVLFDAETREIHPIDWWQSNRAEDPAFRIPAAAYWSGDRVEANQWETPSAIGFEALAMAQADPDRAGVLLENFKAILKVGLAHSDPDGSPLEIQWSAQHRVPITAFIAALQSLLAQLKATIARSRHVSEFAGIIVNVCADDTPTYRFNLREAILGAELVEQSDRIFFLENAIATVLSTLDAPTEPSLVVPDRLQAGRQLYNTDWQGIGLAIDAGADATEVTLVELPNDLTALNRACFWRRSIAYGGNDLNRDILLSLLTAEGAIAGIEELQVNDIPPAGESDLASRYRLQQQMQSLPLGRELWQGVETLKMALQHRDRFALELGDRSQTVTRKDLERQVLFPFVQRLNCELNALLGEAGIAVQGIDRAICTGGTASWSAIARWLRQKLPNATIVQDIYPNHQTSACTRAAYGLATLPLHPQVLDIARHQYDDHFLLLELLRIFPERPIRLEELLSLLERRGISPRACRERLLHLLQGSASPTLPETNWLSETAARDSSNRHLQTPALFKEFFKETGNGLYQIDPERRDRVRQSLQSVAERARQPLDEPLAIALQLPQTGGDR